MRYTVSWRDSVRAKKMRLRFALLTRRSSFSKERENGLLIEINKEETERKQRLTSSLPIEIKSNSSNNNTSVSDKLE